MDYYCQVTTLNIGHGIRIGDAVWVGDETYRVIDRPDLMTFSVMPEWVWSDRQFQRFLLLLTAGAALFYGYVGLWHWVN